MKNKKFNPRSFKTMNIAQLRTKMMKSKKDNPQMSNVLQSILATAQLIAKEDGNRETVEGDIIAAAKKEIKMAQQSKDAGAPHNPMTFEVCAEFLPKTMSVDETKNAVTEIISIMPEKSMKMMGKIMNELKTKYGESLDASLVSKIVKEMLSN